MMPREPLTHADGVALTSAAPSTEVDVQPGGASTLASAVHAGTVSGRASWDKDRDAFLVQLMTAQAKAGKRSDSGFKKEAWNEVTLAFNNKFKSVLTKQQIKTRVQTLKGKYTAVKAMLSASGFGWDEARQHHPKVADYRNTPMPLYKQLGKLFDGTFATGEYALASDELCTSDFVAGSQAPPTLLSSSSGHVAHAQCLISPGPSRSSPDEQQPVEVQANSLISAYQSTPVSISANQNVASASTKKRRTENGGVMIAAAIENIAEEMRNRTAKLKVLSPSQKAIKILQKYYADDLPTSSLVQAFDVMIDEKKASLFVVMEPGSARDAWLLKQLQD